VQGLQRVHEEQQQVEGQQMEGSKWQGSKRMGSNADQLISMQLLEWQAACMDWEHGSMMLLLMGIAFWCSRLCALEFASLC